ncbi:MAG: hypothetical protein ACD_63C00070G0014 [uncultured bacterium]|nr:MAG: hypothetical protein ACD_63C00070G0014 [uncultured bacterium]
MLLRVYERVHLRIHENFMEKFTRKIRKVSSHSLSVVLPRKVVRNFGWRKGQKLELVFGGRKHELIVRDWKRK